MSSLTKIQLQHLRERVNGRLDEFAEGGGPVFEPMTPGVLRLVVGVFEEIRKEEESEVEEKRLLRSIELGKERAAVLEARLTTLGNEAFDAGYQAAGQFVTPQERIEARRAMTDGEVSIEEVAVHGPTGAAIARQGAVQLHGDGTASFDHNGEPIHFRITLDDDEASADRYYRGFNDGVEFVESGEAEAVKDPAYWGEQSQPESDSIDAATGIADDDWCELDEDEAAEPPDYDPMLDFGSSDPNAPATPLSRAVMATLGPEHTLVAPLIPRRQRTLAEADDLAAELSDIIDGLQAMAEDGEMPTVMAWDEGKPLELPHWQIIKARHDIASWSTLAEMAGLRYEPAKRGTYTRGPVERLKSGPKPEPMPALLTILEELQKQSSGTGDMPTQTTFDTARPATWPTALDITRKLGMSWAALAKEAGLKERRHAREAAHQSA